MFKNDQSSSKQNYSKLKKLAAFSNRPRYILCRLGYNRNVLAMMVL